MKFFASSDIHGYYDEWMDALDKAGFDPKNENHRLVVCGDIFDRGRQPKQILDFLNRDDIINKTILIRGNHEDLAEEAIKRGELWSHDMSNGTAGTFIDLDSRYLLSPEVTLKSIAKNSGLDAVFKRCVDYYETEHYIFVHGWIPYTDTGQGKAKYNPRWRYASKKKWQQARWFSCVDAYKQKIFEPNKTIVCGHWHCSSLWHLNNPNMHDEFGAKENFEPFMTDDIIALDACTAHSHKVNVVVIDD